jgi:hypothetical protein
MATLINVLLLKSAWIASVLGAAYGAPWFGPLVVGVAVAYHIGRAPAPRRELALLALAASLGMIFDSALVAVGWVNYPAGQWHPMLAPYWIVALWIGFATTLNVSLKWLRGRNVLAFIFGAVGGPLSYLAGVNLGAATFLDKASALLALSLGWAIIMPLLMAAAARLDGWRPARGHPPAEPATQLPFPPGAPMHSHFKKTRHEV